MTDTITIPLTKGFVAIVDADCEWLLRWKWHVSGGHPRARGLRYAQRSQWIDGKKRLIYMHRQIVQAEDGVQVDHRDHDCLNNRRSNLRICLPAQNIGHARRPVGVSGFRGVTPSKGRWAAQITTHGTKRRSLGRFDTATEAARAYDREASAAWGEFAILNFPEEYGRPVEGEATPYCPHHTERRNGSGTLSERNAVEDAEKAVAA